MRIDHSAAKMFWECPLKYYARYVQKHPLATEGVIGIEPNWEREPLVFGGRVHELLAAHYAASTGGAGQPSPQSHLANQALEDEAQAMFAAYQAHYPFEEFEVVDVERTVEVPLPCEDCDTLSFDAIDCPTRSHHTYVFKVDALVRTQGGLLHIMDHKTENRNSKANSQESWASKPQVGLYQWAAKQHYKQPMGAIFLNILKRQSLKGQEPPIFYRRELLRTPEQEAAAVRWLVYTANQIEACAANGYWPDNRNNCVPGVGYSCDYDQLHNDWGGSPTELLQIKYKPAEAYLDV